MLEEAYKVWYRLERWHSEEQNMNLVRKHMGRVAETIGLQDTTAYALTLEKEGKLEEAYKVWYNLLTDAQKKQASLAQDKWADPDLVKKVNDNVNSFTENLTRLGEAVEKQGADPESLKKAVLEEGPPPKLQEQISQHFRNLAAQAEKDEEADRAKTNQMWRKLTQAAPPLDPWVFLFVPLLFLAGGYLIFGKETYAR